MQLSEASPVRGAGWAILVIVPCLFASPRLLAQTGEVMFVTPSLDVGDQPICIAVGDFNGDGAQDLATADSL